MTDVQQPSPQDKFATDESSSSTPTSATGSSSSSTLSSEPRHAVRSACGVGADVKMAEEGPGPGPQSALTTSTASGHDDGTSSAWRDGAADAEEEGTAATTSDHAAKTFPRQIGNAWGIKSNPADSSVSQPPNDSHTNAKKRPNNTLLPSATKSRPNFAAIMREQESEKKGASKPSPSRAKVSFCENQQVIESEEDRQMRLAIEASLRDQQHPPQEASHAFGAGAATKMPPPALRGDFESYDARCENNFAHEIHPTDGDDDMDLRGEVYVGGENEFAYNDRGKDDVYFMDEDMRMAIALSLQDANGGGGGGGVASEKDKKPSAAERVTLPLGAESKHPELPWRNPWRDATMEQCGEEDEKPSAAELRIVPGGERGSDDSLPSAFAFATHPPVAAVPAASAGGAGPSAFHGLKAAPSSSAAASTFDAFPAVAAASAASKPPPSFDATALSTASKPPPPRAAAAAVAMKPPPPPAAGDDSEIARALHEAELREYETSRSARDAAEAASLKLAMALQEEEDAARERTSNRDAVAGLLNVGVRTVGREEFNSLKTGKDDKDRMTGRRKQEERGMGKLLSSKNDYIDGNGGDVVDAGDEYYYYADDRLKSDDAHHDDDFDEADDGGGIRMNSQSSSSAWTRFDKDTFIGPNNEIRTKHDPELKHKSNAADLLRSHGSKLKEAEKRSVAVSDRAYNAFKRAESRQSGFKKGVAKQGHGRAEDAGTGKTRGGAMDGDVRLHIAAAINAGLIERCGGVVKEGKEALVYHADGGSKSGAEGETSSAAHYSGDGTSLETVGSDGYDVAVKVFKRISEFKGRGTYVDGDPRYHKQKFKTNDQRDQVVLWTEKEYRNLVRAYRAGVPVPKPLYRKENVLFLRFLGEDGWPSPQLKEIDIKKGSKKWTTLYSQTLVAVRRLYHCARLVHADLSEYNLLVCPSWQASRGRLVPPGERSPDDETLRAVLIDFGQAVEVGHPSAAEWLRRDLATVRDFFVRQGIKTLPNEDAERFVTDPVEEAEDAEDDEAIADEGRAGTDDMEVDSDPAGPGEDTWRHVKRGWNDKKEMESLLEMLRRNGR